MRLIALDSGHSIALVSDVKVLRPDSLPRLWRYINLLLTYLLTYLH